MTPTLDFLRADDAWERELVLAFGKQEAGAARYQPRGQGALGTPLRAAYAARILAQAAWDKARMQ